MSRTVILEATSTEYTVDYGGPDSEATSKEPTFRMENTNEVLTNE